jgi:hypothetical protein
MVVIIGPCVLPALVGVWVTTDVMEVMMVVGTSFADVGAGAYIVDASAVTTEVVGGKVVYEVVSPFVATAEVVATNQRLRVEQRIWSSSELTRRHGDNLPTLWCVGPQRKYSPTRNCLRLIQGVAIDDTRYRYSVSQYGSITSSARWRVLSY